MKDYSDHVIIDRVDMNDSNEIEMRETFPLLEKVCEADPLQSSKMKDTSWIEFDNVIYELRKCEKWKCEKCLPTQNGRIVDSNENILDCFDFEKDEWIIASETELENIVTETKSESLSKIDIENNDVSKGNYVENERESCSVCNGFAHDKNNSERNEMLDIPKCNLISLELESSEPDRGIEGNKAPVTTDRLLDNRQTTCITCDANESGTSTGKEGTCNDTSEKFNGSIENEAELNVDDTNEKLSAEGILDVGDTNTDIDDDLSSAINNPNLFSDCDDSDDDVFDFETRTTTTLPQCANYFRSRTRRSGQTQSESAILDHVNAKTDKPHHQTVSDSAIISALSKRTNKCTDRGARKKSVHFAIFPYVIEIPRVSDLEQEFFNADLERIGNFNVLLFSLILDVC